MTRVLAVHPQLLDDADVLRVLGLSSLADLEELVTAGLLQAVRLLPDGPRRFLVTDVVDLAQRATPAGVA